MRLVFAGTPEFARVALARLHAAGHEIALVLTQPDRPAGRGMKPQASPVKQFALENGIALAQPRGLRLDGRHADEAAQARAAIEAARADAMVVAAYGLILPQWVLNVMAPTLPAARGSLPPEGALAPRGGPSALPQRLGCLNIHASLLPRWRGAAPIQRALEAGDSETGVTIMQMDAGLDTGAVLLMEKLAIADDDTAASLHDKLAELGGRLIVRALALAQGGALQPAPQPAEGVRYAHKIEKAEAVIDWTQAASVIERRIRAFNPFPGASSALDGETIKIWCARLDPAPSAGQQAPGTVVASGEAGVSVQCGQGVLRLTQMQRAGGKRLPAREFLRGFAVPAGRVFGAPQV